MNIKKMSKAYVRMQWEFIKVVMKKMDSHKLRLSR